MNNTEEESKCVVCQRIPPKIVFFYAHSVFDKRCSKKMIHQIAIAACKAINYVDNKKRAFFCGKTQLGILSGLYYLLAMNTGRIRITQIDLAESLPSAMHTQYYRFDRVSQSLSSITVSKSYREWLKLFPELFPHLNQWLCKCGTWNSNTIFFCSKCNALSGTEE